MTTLVGLDVGTQAVRALVVRSDGTRLAERTAPLVTEHTGPGRVEQDAGQWWDAAISVLRAAVTDPQVDAADIAGLSYACTSCTLVALDLGGRPLRPALLWMDERAWAEAAEVTATKSPVLRYSGSVVSPQWMLPKVKWLMAHEPEIVARAHRIVEQTDFFTYRLTGRWTLGYNNLVAKWNYAKPCGGWPAGFLSSIGLDGVRAKWPTEILPLGAPLGPILPAVAEATALPLGTPVFQGGIDSHVAMLGTSVTQPGELAVVMGSSTVLIGQSLTPIFADNWGPYPDAVVPGAFTLGGGQTTTGALVHWLLYSIARTDTRTSSVLLDELEVAAALVPPGSDGLLALDFFAGNRTPYKDPEARGLLVGLSLRHGLPHLLRALYEAIAYGSRNILQNLTDHDYEVRRLVASGGGARSELAVAILADVLGQPIELAAEPESTALGAAIVAGTGAGVFRSYREAADALVRIRGSVEPRRANKEVYDFYFGQYVQGYESIKDVMHEIVRFEERRASPVPARV